MDFDGIKRFKEEIDKVRNVVILTHVRPDGDAIGSSLALCNYLIEKRYDCRVLLPSPCPATLNWISGSEHLVDAENDITLCKGLIEKAEIIICLDFGVLMRLDALEDVVRDSKKSKVNVDHHIDFENFADITIRDIRVSSTAELIYSILHDWEAGMENTSVAVAECLYVGMLTDTGGFKYGTTTAEVHWAVGDLIDCGIDILKIHNSLYNNFSEGRMRFVGFCVYEKMKVLRELKSAYIAVSLKEMQRFGIVAGDTESLVNYPLSIAGIVVSVLLIENEGFIKMSFRSIGNIAINEIAKEFGGGGHFNAAGGVSYKTLEETEAKLLELLPCLKPQTDKNVD